MTDERFTLSTSAVDRLKKILTKKPQGTFLRILIQGGGCSGFQYVFSFETELQSDDIVFEQDGVQYVIDDISLPLIEGGMLDYVQEMIGASFQIKNPQAKASCGCGTSFAVNGM